MRLEDHARSMRRQPTEPEKRLWRHLSKSQLGGFKFRRQAVIEPYIVDFLCPAKALIVEVDGDTHDASSDRARDAMLLKRGYLTFRVTNREVMTNMEGVLVALLSRRHEIVDRWPHPNPVSGEQRPALFRACRGHDRPDTPEGEGLEP